MSEKGLSAGVTDRAHTQRFQTPAGSETEALKPAPGDVAVRQQSEEVLPKSGPHER